MTKTVLIYDKWRPTLSVGDVVCNRVTGLRIIARKVVREHPQSISFTVLGEMDNGQGYPPGHAGFVESCYARRLRVIPVIEEDEGGAWATPSWEEP